MTILYALTVARATAIALQNQCSGKEDIERIADALENLKEVLAQIHVSEAYAEHVPMTKFCDRVLWSTRGLLLHWEVTTTSLQELPVKKMPGFGKNPVWRDHASEPGEVLERSLRGSQLPAGSAGNIDRGALGLAFPLCSSVRV